MRRRIFIAVMGATASFPISGCLGCGPGEDTIEEAALLAAELPSPDGSLDDFVRSYSDAVVNIEGEVSIRSQLPAPTMSDGTGTAVLRGVDEPIADGDCVRVRGPAYTDEQRSGFVIIGGIPDALAGDVERAEIPDTDVVIL